VVPLLPLLQDGISLPLKAEAVVVQVDAIIVPDILFLIMVGAKVELPSLMRK
jgi:hypothetical protein